MSPIRQLLTLLFACLMCLPAWGYTSNLPQPNIQVSGGHRRIDICWQEKLGLFYTIERSQKKEGPFKALHEGVRITPRYSDFVGSNKQSYYYRVRTVSCEEETSRITGYSPWSSAVEGTSVQQKTWELVSDIQKANFDYFWLYAHPISGLIRERAQQKTDTQHAQWLRRCCTVGATGMAFFNYAVGVKRGWISREQAAERVNSTLDFLAHKTTRYHGAWSHWIDGTTGETIPFSRIDDGADLVETAFLAQGLIFVRQFFDASHSQEQQIRATADRLWREIEWTFFSNHSKDNPLLLWHWSPTHDFKINLPIRGANECHIVHLLAMVSPTYAVGPEYYQNAWLNSQYHEERTLEGIHHNLGVNYGGPLFFAHYSYLGLDPHTISFGGQSYFEHYSDFCRSQYRYAQHTYPSAQNKQIWGLTASYDPRGYKVHKPGRADNGTISPTAALSSWPYAPDLALEACLTLYEQRGAELWGEFGFYDAFNDAKKWISPGHISIDVAPIAPMIENFRTGLCWKIFHSSPEAQQIIQLTAEIVP